MTTSYSKCPGCKTILPTSDYPADNRYGILSPECRHAFDEILVKEAELFGYSVVHRLIIDAYGVQHPPHIEVQEALHISQRFIYASIQSVAIHLIALYLAIEKKRALQEISKDMDRILTFMSQRKIVFEKLEPPIDLGKIRAIDVRNALYTGAEISLDEYERLAWHWAYSAWSVWVPQHALVKQWYEKYAQLG